MDNGLLQLAHATDLWRKTKAINSYNTLGKFPCVQNSCVSGKEVTSFPCFLKVDGQDNIAIFANSCKSWSVGEKGKNA
jgi:hypothetical protein